MDARQAMFAALRSRLCNNASLVAMVATRAITVSLRKPPSTYPAIRMRVVGANGPTFDTFLGGDVYLNIYTKSNNPTAVLASIYNVAHSLLHDKATAITTSNIGVGRIWEQYVDYPQYEDDPGGIYYLGSRYSFTAQNRT